MIMKAVPSELIQYLVERKFMPAGAGPFPSFEEWNLNRKNKLPVFSQTESEYIAKLELLSLSELEEEVAQVAEKEATEREQWASIEDRTRFFNQPDARADFDLWSKMVRWTLDEATALSFGKDPEVVSWDKVSSFRRRSSFADSYAKLRNLVLNANKHGALPDEASPSEFVAWADRTKIALPKELIDAVREQASRIGDFDVLNAELKALRERAEKLETEAKKEKPLPPRERDTFLKIVLGMAIHRYKHDPRKLRGGAANQIAIALLRYGLKVGDDSIREKLKEAWDEFGSEVKDTLPT